MQMLLPSGTAKRSFQVGFPDADDAALLLYCVEVGARTKLLLIPVLGRRSPGTARFRQLHSFAFGMKRQMALSTNVPMMMIATSVRASFERTFYFIFSAIPE